MQKKKGSFLNHQIEPFILRIASADYMQILLPCIRLCSPYFIPSSWIFEFRGDLDDLQPDFSFCIESTKPLLEYQAMENGLPSAIKDTWRPFFRFLHQCAEKDCFSKHNLSKSWIEFDLGSALEETPCPSLHFRITQETDIKELMRDIGYLNNPIFSHPFIKQLHPRYVGFMLGRASQACRLYLVGEALMDLGELENDFFKDAPLEIKRPLFDFLQTISPLLGGLGLQIGLDRSLDSAIGIECYLPSGISLANQAKRWESILAKLVEKSWVTQKRRESALAWIADDHNTESGLAHFISHIKLAYQPNQSMITKIYVASALTLSDQERSDLLSSIRSACYC